MKENIENTQLGGSAILDKYATGRRKVYVRVKRTQSSTMYRQIKSWDTSATAQSDESAVTRDILARIHLYMFW
jgi:hypothetical protein